MVSKQGYICCSIAKVTPLVVVLLRQYYSSYNIANSRCSGLKTIGFNVIRIRKLPKQHRFAGISLKQDYFV